MSGSYHPYGGSNKQPPAYGGGRQSPYGASQYQPNAFSSYGVPQQMQGAQARQQPQPQAQARGQAPIAVQEKFKKLPKIELGANSREARHMYDNMADLYSMLIMIEHLETAWTRGSIKDNEYTTECSGLISKYKTQCEALEDKVPDIEKFVKEYRMHVSSAVKRVKKGIPGTIDNPSIQGSDEKSNVYVAETVQHFITAMDGLKLNMRAVDDLQPTIHELMEALNKVSKIPPDHISKEKVKHWLIELNKMRASDELDEDQARQMSFDLENGYANFVKFLSKK